MTNFRFVIRHLMVVLLLAASFVFGQDDDASRAQVTAATADAAATLRNDILAVRITPTLTVNQFVQQTKSQEDLDQVLARAQQIGGPRWIDPQTCQVKLELPAEWVSTVLISDAETHAKTSPIPSAELDRQLADWRTRTFTSTGTSLSTQRLGDVRPVDAGNAWAGVSEQARAQAVAAAREDAGRVVLQSIRGVDLSGGRTLGNLLDREIIQRRMTDWLAARPVTQIRFKENLQVEVTVSVPPSELFQYLLQIAPSAPDVPLPMDGQSQARFQSEFMLHIAPAIGQASVGARPAQSPRIALPLQSPVWVNQPLEADGIATRGASPLRTKSNAETKAGEALRARVGALRLSRNATLDDLAVQNSAVSEAITRTLLRARVEKVDYRSDGSVLVRLSIDPRELWQELRQAAE